jgi:hypothetical protein
MRLERNWRGGAGFESTSCCHVLAGSCVGIALDADTVPSFRSWCSLLRRYEYSTRTSCHTHAPAAQENIWQSQTVKGNKELSLITSENKVLFTSSASHWFLLFWMWFILRSFISLMPLFVYLSVLKEMRVGMWPGVSGFRSTVFIFRMFSNEDSFISTSL